MSELDDLKKEAVERIYLIPDRDEGRLRYVWCDDPSPEYGMRDDDAVEYVRRDKYDALAAHVERLTGLLREHHEDFMSDGSADWDESDWDGRVAHALEDTPETSLTHLKAQWQADAPEEEAREWPADKYTECSHVRESILDSAAQLRQKSEAYK